MAWRGKLRPRERKDKEKGLRRGEDWTRRQDALLQPAAPPASIAPLGNF